MSKRVGSESSRPSKRPKNDPPQPRAVGWSRNDQIRLDATKGPEWTTWKRFENLMSQDPLTFLKDFTIEARPEKDLDGVDGDTIANPNWTDKFCSALSQLACVPAFWKNPGKLSMRPPVIITNRLQISSTILYDLPSPAEQVGRHQIIRRYHDPIRLTRPLSK